MKKITKNYVRFTACVAMLILSTYASTFAYSGVENEFLEVKSSQTQSSGSIAWSIGHTFPGTSPTMSPKVVTLNGTRAIGVGTDGGVVFINVDDGRVIKSVLSAFPVIDFEVVDDVSGDGLDDLIVASYTREIPNVAAISIENGDVLWSFVSTIDVVDELFTPIEVKLKTWDVELIDDITGDDRNEVVVSTWKSIVVLNGASGSVVWEKNGYENDVWESIYLNQTIISGSQSGKIVARNSVNGELKWIVEVVPSTDFRGLSDDNSIDDLQSIIDVDGDGTLDVLVSSDDGKIRLISGNSGLLIDEREIADLMGTFSKYTVESRMFYKSGANIFPLGDIDGDNVTEYFVVSRDLGKYESNPYIYGTIVNVKDNSIDIVAVINWSNADFRSFSQPTFAKINDSNRIFFFSSEQRGLLWHEASGGNLFNDLNETSLDGVIGGIESSQFATDYLINVGVVSEVDRGKIFGVSRYGTYFLYDATIDRAIWVKSRSAEDVDIIEFEDVTGDEIYDLLVKRIGASTSEWEQVDKAIYSVSTIDARDGRVVWEHDAGANEEIRDVITIGDIDDDGTSDIAVLNVPTKIPKDVADLIENLVGYPELDLVDKVVEQNVYRALLANHTNVELLSGSNGTVLWKSRFIDFPYDYYRTFGNSGNYTNPKNAYSSRNSHYLRTTGQIPSDWIAGWNDVQWESRWNPRQLYNVSQIEIDEGTPVYGSYLDVNQDSGYYSVKSDSGRASVVFRVPIDFSDEKKMGLIEYNLSQIERTAALKIQSVISTNDTTDLSFYNFTYELYNGTNSKWVSCDWDLDNYWSGFEDLQGSFNSTYRSSYDGFELDNNFRRDDFYVKTRGTFNCQDGVDFDYENKTTLSHFNDDNVVSVRVNVTYNKPFQLNFSSFGVGCFYWGMFGNEYDEMGIYHRDEGFTDDNLLDLNVQGFVPINRSLAKAMDVLISVGGLDKSECSRLVLLDTIQKKSSVKWTANDSYLPRGFVQLLSLNDEFVVSGEYAGDYSHVKFSEIDWNYQVSFFENYTDQKTRIDGEWKIDYEELLDSVVINEDGDIALVVGQNASTINMKFIDPDTLEIVSVMDVYTGNLRLSGYDYGNPLRFTSDFKSILSYKDFNGDGYFDHVGFYEVIGIDGEQIRVYSGKTNGTDPELLFSWTVNWLLDDGAVYYSAISDVTGDNITDAAIAVQHLGKITLTRVDVAQGSVIDEWIVDPKGYSYDGSLVYYNYGGIKIRNIGEIDSSGRNYLFMEGKFESYVLDHNRKEIVLKFNAINDVQPFQDVNGDGKKDLLAFSENVVYCVNSLFDFEIDVDQTNDNRFRITANSNSSYNRLELIIDGYTHGTSQVGFFTSLGGGVHEITMYMYDVSGLVVAVKSMTIDVPFDYTMIIVSVAVPSSSIVAYFIIAKYKAKIKKITKDGKK